MLDAGVAVANDFDDGFYLTNYGQYTLSSRPRLEIATSTLLFCVCIGLFWVTSERASSIGDDLPWLELSALFTMSVNLIQGAFASLLLIEEGTARVAHWVGFSESPELGFNVQTIIRVVSIFAIAATTFTGIVVLTHTSMDLYFPKLRPVIYTGGG